MPLLFLDTIISWYSNLVCKVKWGEFFSEPFTVKAGVRQGGILSPDFYCLYVDDLIKKLRSLGKGCHYLNHFASALFYADDMALLAPSLKSLQYLLDVCSTYCIEWDICLNAKKSRLLYFGKKANISHGIYLNGKLISWAEEWPYLGVTLKSDKCFSCSVKDRIRKFYRSTNSILRIDGKSNDMIMLRLLKAHCVPILTV